MAKLKFWRRDLEESDQDDDDERFRGETIHFRLSHVPSDTFSHLF